MRPQEINLAEHLLKPAVSAVLLKPELHFYWLAIEGLQPNIPENIIEEEEEEKKESEEEDSDEEEEPEPVPVVKKGAKKPAAPAATKKK